MDSLTALLGIPPNTKKGLRDKVIMSVLYDGGIPSQDVKLMIQRMADAMGVSYTAFFNRLKELKLFEIRPLEEYIHQNLQYGGAM